jgi:hypothetical protein
VCIETLLTQKKIKMSGALFEQESRERVSGETKRIFDIPFLFPFLSHKLSMRHGATDRRFAAAASGAFLFF